MRKIHGNHQILNVFAKNIASGIIVKHLIFSNWIAHLPLSYTYLNFRENLGGGGNENFRKNKRLRENVRARKLPKSRVITFSLIWSPFSHVAKNFVIFAYFHMQIFTKMRKRFSRNVHFRVNPIWMLADLGAWFACLEGISPESAGGAPVLWLAQACRKLCSLLAISETPRKILCVRQNLFLNFSRYADNTTDIIWSWKITRKQDFLWTTRRQSQYEFLITGTRTKEKIELLISSVLIFRFKGQTHIYYWTLRSASHVKVQEVQSKIFFYILWNAVYSSGSGLNWASRPSPKKEKVGISCLRSWMFFLEGWTS